MGAVLKYTKNFSVWTCVFFLSFHTSLCFKPVIIIHGILDSASDLTDLKGFIEEANPGTEVHAIDMFDYYNSFQPLWYQVETIRNVTNPIMKKAKNGVHVIGYSQGGLVARGIIQTTDSHNVDSFIALSSPLNGQFGDTYVFSWLFPNYVKEEMYKLFYSTYGQRWSIGNYWKDPHEIEKYQRYSNYLAQLNNETHPSVAMFRESWRENFARLGKVVLVGGPDDDVISPWQSAQFGFYDKDENVIPMRDLKIYKEDVFGLKTLDKKRSLFTCTVPGVKHIFWHKTETVFKKCVKPFLT